MKLFKSAWRALQRGLEEIAFYISSMTLFNLIYALRTLGANWNDEILIPPCNLAAFLIAMILVAAGIIYTIMICVKDHSASKNTLGKTAKIISCKDITGDNYFSKYSLLILTGNSLPMFQNFVGLTIYLIVLLTVGFIFVRQKMDYLNPIVILVGYKVVQAKCKVAGTTAEYYFIFKRGAITVGKEVNFLNIPNRIICLKEVAS